ncbi:MAG TPA: hypothetical protein VHM90_07260, partial [Phycisphaerae bacterium]|nr:hypothetical protein [Phycisphaerae bacterium]
AVFWAVAARMLFRRAATVLAATAAGMVAIGGGAILCLRATAVTAQPMAVWDAERAGPPFNAAGIDTRVELAGFASRFGGSVELEAPVVLPIAATAREYWGLAHVTIHWEGHSSKMRVELGPRQSVLVQKRSFRAGELITRFPETAEDRRRLLETYHLKGDSSWWVMRGYVFAGDAGYFDSGGVVFSAWARGHPEAMGSLAAWYAMSFRADSEYLIWVDSGVPHVVEFEGGAAARR